MIRNRLLMLGVALVGVGCSRTTTEPPKPPEVSTTPKSDARVSQQAKPTAATLRISPSPASLELRDPGLQLVVEKVEGETSTDVTHQVTWTHQGNDILSLDNTGFARALKPGKTKVSVRLDDRVATAAIEVRAEGKQGLSFARDVQPILTHAGCNTGGCHARAEGQGGLHLSLYGFDAVSDAQAISRQAGGRRVNLLDPDSSLVLQKASGQIPHGGGLRLSVNSPEYNLVRSWISEGARSEPTESEPAISSLTVVPSSARLASAPGTQQLRTIARFTDGTERDVTRLASYHSNDDGILTVTATGQARLLKPGETNLIVRYGSMVLPVRVASPFNPGQAFAFPEATNRNVIDRELFKRLRELNLPPSEPATDASFLRRVSLDLTGQLPEPDEIRSFLADESPDKREKKVDSLLAKDDHFDFWTLKYGDLLQVSQARFGTGAGAYQRWLQQQVRANRPWNELVKELLTAVGDPLQPTTGGPVNYALDGPDPQTQSELAARRFLGLRLRCAQCHDHPFDVWTQDDYFNLAAFFAKVDRGTPGNAGMMNVKLKVGVKQDATLEHPRTHQQIAPRPLDRTSVEIKPDQDPRGMLAEWMTRPANPYFARAYVNWVWAQFFGKGLVEPVDDMSAANPPVHPELLEALAQEFIASGYDTRALIRTIATSQAYGLSSATVPGNAHDDRFFSHQSPRPLTAHQMADALAQATQVPNVFANRSARSRTKAIQIFDPGNASTILDTFGRCSRATTCSPIGMPQVSLSQALLLIGGDVVDGKVSNVQGYLAHLLELDPSPAEIVEYLYLRTLCRTPTDQEQAHWAEEFKAAGSVSEVAEDLFWALLNSREFAFNH